MVYLTELSLDFSHVTVIEARALRSERGVPEFNVQSSRLKVRIKLKR